MRFIRFSAMALAAAGLILVNVPAQAETLAPDAVRTYCETDGMQLESSAQYKKSSLPSGGLGGAPKIFVDDNDADLVTHLPGDPTNVGGTEVVWEVIGTLGQADEGEGYCGYISTGPTLISSRGSWANRLENCIAVVRFKPTAAASSAKLVWNGFPTLPGGVRLSVAVTLCEIDDDTPDNEYNGAVHNWTAAPNPDPDCIIGTDDFAGATFTGIHDVNLRRNDNKVGIVGGVSDLDFLEGGLGYYREMDLAQEAVDAINDAVNAGSWVTFVIHCDATRNGWRGGLSNALVIHDPTGDGFPGNTGTIDLVTAP